MHSFWHEDAAEELKSEVSWLEAQAPGLGQRFLDDVSTALRTIEEFPELGAHRSLGCRRFLLMNFPFDLVYSLSEGQIVVLALAHQRRLPGYWKNRLPK